MFSIVNDRLQIGGRPVPFVSTPHQGGRIEPKIVVLHDTAGPDGSAVSWFKNPKSRVSAHFVVARDGAITQLVECDRKAWHAGKSSWRGHQWCNDFSIGIEIENPGKLTLRGDKCVAWFGKAWPESECLRLNSKAHGGEGYWLPYTAAQIKAVDQIVRAILIAYPSVIDIVGHFEISPRRKVDVGPHYPLDRTRAMLADRDGPLEDEVRQAQEILAELGYFPGAIDGVVGVRTRAALRTFQEQNGIKITGEIDQATAAALADPAAKPMPSAARDDVTKEELKASGSETMAAAWIGKRITEAQGASAAVDATTKVLDQVEQSKAAGERVFSLVDWLMTPEGVRVIVVFGLCAATWYALDKIEWSRLRDHMLGKNVGR
jgi:N-acetylmuramoyl-L-alanine amidase